MTVIKLNLQLISTYHIYRRKVKNKTSNLSRIIQILTLF